MGWFDLFGSADELSYEDDLHATWSHEIGHAVVTEELGGRCHWVKVVSPYEGGAACEADSDEHHAIISLAGKYAGELAGRPAGIGDRQDEKDARESLKFTGMSYREADREARRLVYKNRAKIEKYAKRRRW